MLTQAPKYTVLTEGHKYLLNNFEKTDENGQTLQFIEKIQDPNQEKGVLQTVNNGTTNEALLEVLINRLSFLSSKFPCRENSIAITKLDEALMWLEKRTANRKARGVEGMHKA